MAAESKEDLVELLPRVTPPVMLSQMGDSMEVVLLEADMDKLVVEDS